MAYTCEILKRQNAEHYNILFHDCPDGLIQQSVQWADAIGPLSPDTPYFIIARDDVKKNAGGLPLYKFNTEIGSILTSIPHPGPLGGVLHKNDFGEALKKELYNALVKEALALSNKLGCLSLTIITNPFMSDAELYNQDVPPDYIFDNFCQIIDLNRLFPSSGSYFSEKSGFTIDRNVRRNLKKAAENNVTVVWGTDADFESWYPIHAKRHTELGAEPLPKPLLNNILQVLSPVQKAGLAVALVDNKIVGGCIFIWNSKIVDAYILSSDSSYIDMGINHAITDFAARYFYSQGLRWFNWQGCKRNSGVYRFKQSWGGEETSYQFLTWRMDGFEKIFSYTLDKIAEEYKWHYVAPFDAIKNRALNGYYNK